MNPVSFWGKKRANSSGAHGPAGPQPEKQSMPKINGNEIRIGDVIMHQDKLWVAVKTDHVKPGKGGAYAVVELKAIIEGTKLNERFRSAETVERVELEKRDFTYLYEQGENLVFMDQESYDQIELDKEFVGERAAFLQDGMKVTLEMYEDRALGLKMPQQVTMTIIEADPVVRGQTAANSFKAAKLENGLRVMVPPFIANGEKIVVSTEDVTYVRRAE